MTANEAIRARPVPIRFLLAVATSALVVASVALTAVLLQGPGTGWGRMAGQGMLSGSGAISGRRGTGMMLGLAASQAAVAPGQPGFVAGTAATPRVVHVWAGPGYAFSPRTIAVARGETVTFEVTVMGPTSHEFMVGPADDVAADVPGTPEIDGLGMMQTRALTYTFDGSGPFAFACHAPGHFEAGMRGTITVVP